MTAIMPQDVLQLQQSFAKGLRALPGAVELRSFGSLAHGTADRLSDIDLELLTTYPDASIAARLAMLAQVAPIWMEWRISPSHSGWAATILFDGVSPYQHLDLGITSAHQAHSIDALGDKVILWTQEAAPATPLANPSPIYAPSVGSTEHAMLDQLLSAIRYVKARKRGQVLAAYRFASALTTWTFAMLEAQRMGDLNLLRERPSTSSFLALDRHLPDAIRRDLLSLLDFSTPARMDAAVLALLRHNLALHDTLPGAPPFPPDVATRMLAFIEEELHLR